MSTHTIHEDIQSHGLADGCPRCEEHAEHPVRDLDRDNLRDLISLAVDNSIQPRSNCEARAVANVKTAMERFGAIAATSPQDAMSYLEKWGVVVLGIEVK